ncbi:hypothetical protein DICPUDRAFT_152568 [Dictyostelium purpureum]|uniref:Kinesin motor domain-containing protein n=1 Tax=Dictyostelium purpureum TaxID=5786 RepID=F0ZLQ2_DICPU|nr:uncharacterized protein DICPUDRAFT_152568 [Dictyostelium purpureum]EGC35154.1 hypothetical protein DICPUDRAFT_152568 [Dictyostelium purpureum]|eukprot:XP_003288347.1 hypothetical protein DICPUDRAFT_152568 [Dictyostelium purpureum]
MDKPLNSITNIINNFHNINSNNPNSPSHSTNLNNLNNNRPSLLKKPIQVSDRISYPLSTDSKYIQQQPLLTNSVINLDSNSFNNSTFKNNSSNRFNQSTIGLVNSNSNNSSSGNNKNANGNTSTQINLQTSRAHLLQKKNTSNTAATTISATSSTNIKPIVKKKLNDFVKPHQTNISSNIRKTIATQPNRTNNNNNNNNSNNNNNNSVGKVSSIANKINNNNNNNNNKMISSPTSDGSLNVSSLSNNSSEFKKFSPIEKSNILSSAPFSKNEKTYSSLQERIGKIDEFTQSFRGNLQTQFDSFNDSFKPPRLSLSVHDLKTRLDYEEKSKENDKLKSEIKNLVMAIQDKDKELLDQKYRISQLTVQNETLQNSLQNANLIIQDLQREIQSNSKRQLEIDSKFNSIQSITSEKDQEIEKLLALLKERDQSIHQLLEDKEQLLEKSRQDEKIRKQLHNTIQELKGSIRVFCRIRPDFNNTTSDQLYLLPPGTENTIDVNTTVTNSFNGETSVKKVNYTFDRVFGPTSTQEFVFEEISQLVQSSLDGYNTCIFSYGQTGSGKTHTLFGGNGSPEQRGMIPRAVQLIFSAAAELRTKGWQYQMECFFLEIYNEAIVDLLNNNRAMVDQLKYDIKHNLENNSTSVTNLTVVPVSSPSKVYDLLNTANKNRSVAKTLCNERSSRSHTVFQLKLMGYNEKSGERTQGLLNLIDLAGSERVSKSGVTGDRLKETQAINKSLSSLSDVISALANKEQHIPYRNSKLTYLLQNSIGGNSKTLMFVNISPEPKDLQESISSLRFAAKVNSCELGQAKKHTKYDSK